VTSTFPDLRFGCRSVSRLPENILTGNLPAEPQSAHMVTFELGLGVIRIDSVDRGGARAPPANKARFTAKKKIFMDFYLLKVVPGPQSLEA